MRPNRTTNVAAVLLALGLALAGCGDDQDPALDAGAPGGDGGSAVDDGDGDDAGAGGDAAGTTPDAAAMGDGLTVEEARAGEAQGSILVRGLLHAESDVVRLCSALAESHPPQCGGPSIEVVGLDLDSIDGLQQEGGVAWTDHEVKVLGILDGEVLSVSDTST